jgi:hypothetical protein
MAPFKHAVIPPVDKEALQWVGILGHTFVVLYTGPDGKRQCGLESCDKDSAIREARTTYRLRSAAVYQQVAAKQWRPVPVPPFKLTASQWDLLLRIAKANEAHDEPPRLRLSMHRSADVLVSLGLLEDTRRKCTETGWFYVRDEITKRASPKGD